MTPDLPDFEALVKVYVESGAHESCVENGMPIPEDMADFAPPCPDPDCCPAAHPSCREEGHPVEDCPDPECCPFQEWAR